MAILLAFKDRLKKLRKGECLTQKKLADVLNYGYTAISNYEQGRTEPSIKDLIRLADYFNVPLDYLVERPPSISIAISDDCYSLIELCNTLPDIGVKEVLQYAMFISGNVSNTMLISKNEKEELEGNKCK